MSTLTDKIGYAKELGILNPEDLSDEQLDAKIALARRKEQLLQDITGSSIKPNGNYAEEIASITELHRLDGYQEQFNVYVRLYMIGSFTGFYTVRTQPDPYLYLRNQVEILFSSLDIRVGTIIRCTFDHDFAWGEQVVEITEDAIVVLQQLDESNELIDPHRFDRRFTKEEFLYRYTPTVRKTGTGIYTVAVLMPETSPAT